MSNEKKCLYCSNEFINNNTRGDEQKYCSVKCRNNAANKRHKEKLINTIKMKYATDDNNRKIIGENNERVGNISNDNNFRKENLSYQDRAVSDSNVLRLLETNFETKVETFQFKMMYENCKQENERLLKEIQSLKIEISQLEDELQETEPEENSIISGVMQQFKTDPVNTINFAQQLIQGIFKQTK
jgi:hypothetical protein